MHKFLLSLICLLACGALTAHADKSFKVTAASRVGSGEAIADVRNSIKLTFKVTLQNTGSEDLEAGDDGYALYLYRGDYTFSSAANITANPVKLTENLQAGSSAQMEVTFSFSASTGSGNYFYVVDPSGNNTTGMYITVKAYEPKLVLNRATNSSDYKYVPLDFGFGSSENRVLTLDFQNDGIAPLSGLECNIEGPFEVSGISEIEAGGSLTVNVKLSATEPGWYEGVLVFTAPKCESKTITARGLITNPDLWTEDFEETVFPGSFLLQNEYWKMSGDPEEIATPGNALWAANTETYASRTATFVTPKLEVRDDDEPLQFFAGRIGSTYTTRSTKLKVLYSADRENWTEILDLVDTDSNSPFGNEFIMNARANLFKRFTLSLPKGEWFLAFEGLAVNVGHITGYRLADVKHDLLHVSHDLPAKASVNTPYTATLILKNMNSKSETDYTVSLYADGQQVATAETEEFGSGEEKEFKITYYPHAEGDVEMKAVFETEDYNFETETVKVTVGEELAVDEFLISGTKATSQMYGPVNAYYTYGQSETIYLEEELNLEPGTRITKLTYLGYRTEGSDTGVTYSAYLASDERDTPYGSGAFRDVEDMTKVKEETYVFPGPATYTGTIDFYTPIFEVNFDRPYEYEGGNLCISFVSQSQKSRNGVFFTPFNKDYAGTSTYGRMIYMKSDSNPYGAIEGTYPYFVIVGTEKPVGNVSGTVTYNADPVSGATIRFSSGDVYYETLSDEDGHYSLTIKQLDRLYKVTATAPDLSYEDSEEREIPEGESCINIAVEEDTNGITSFDYPDGAKVRYFNLQGVEVKKPQSGTILIRVEGSKATRILVP